MAARDHLNPQQFMGVDELLNMHSSEALRGYRRRMLQQPPGPPGSPQNGPWEHNDETRVRSTYGSKSRDLTVHSSAYGELDGPLRSGKIDPVLLEGPDTRGIIAVIEGHHRIIRAHQLGVKSLPVSYDPGSQRHLNEWGAKYGDEFDVSAPKN